jgi:hypothetical protein
MKEPEERKGDVESSENRSSSTPAPKPGGDDSAGREGSRMAMSLREAEVIARNLKESGTRR